MSVNQIFSQHLAARRRQSRLQTGPSPTNGDEFGNNARTGTNGSGGILVFGDRRTEGARARVYFQTSTIPSVLTCPKGYVLSRGRCVPVSLTR